MAMHMGNLPIPIHENGASQDLFYLGWLMLTSKLFTTGSIYCFPLFLCMLMYDYECKTKETLHKIYHTLD